MKKERTIWSDVSEMKRDKSTVWLDASFEDVSEEIRRGNKLVGIAMDSGKIGFKFGKIPVTAVSITTKKEELEKASEPGTIESIGITVPPVPTVKPSRDGEFYKDEEGRDFVIREVPVYARCDAVLRMIATSKPKFSIQKLYELMAIEGTTEVMKEFDKESKKEAKSSRSFFKKLFE